MVTDADVKITSVDGILPPENVPPSIEEGSAEELRQVKNLYENLRQLFVGIDHVVVAKTIGIYMATLMHTSDRWMHIIPGFMNQMDMAANLALNHHQPERMQDGNNEESKEGETDLAQSGDSGVEVKKG